jgi:hypothetical protein
MQQTVVRVPVQAFTEEDIAVDRDDGFRHNEPKSMNIYLELTQELNEGRLRSIICSGQAAVLHKLAVMSKDGDWILREDEEALSRVIAVLGRHGSHYRFGAPLDLRWMAEGWSSHFEFQRDLLRVRTDFFTRPPRLSSADLIRIWKEQENISPPFVGLRDLAELKKTNREKDYAVIGEIARLMPDITGQLLFSRSARDLLAIADTHLEHVGVLVKQRPLLGLLDQGLQAIEEALDAERRALIHANENRMRKYLEAARPWTEAWPDVAGKIKDMALGDAHRIVVQEAEGILPFVVDSEGGPE